MVDTEKKKSFVRISAAGMMCSILCCVRRLNVVRSDALLDQPDAQIKMSMYWLVSQFVLLGGMESFLDKSVSAYYKDLFVRSSAKIRRKLHSRRDRYYWVLANMVLFVFVASCYRYKNPKEDIAGREAHDAGAT